MADTTREHMLEAIIVDLSAVTRSWYEIQEQTGMSDDRCKEVAEQIDDVFARYIKRNS